MTYRSRSIWSHYPPGSGFRFGDPAVEEVLAGIWANYTPDTFADIDQDGRATVIALRRTQMQIDAIVAHEQAKAAKKTAAQRQGRGGR